MKRVLQLYYSINRMERTFFDSPIEIIKELPKDVESITIISCSELFEIVSFPPGLISLSIRDCPIRLLPPVPASLRVLCIEDCQLRQLPSLHHTALRIFCCKNTPLYAIPALPSTVEILNAEDVTFNLLTHQFEKKLAV